MLNSNRTYALDMGDSAQVRGVSATSREAVAASKLVLSPPSDRKISKPTTARAPSVFGPTPVVTSLAV